MAKSIYTVGGAVPSDRLYITRQADTALLNLCREHKFAHVLTARQLGKSSLRSQVVQRLDSEGFVTIDLDLTAIGTPDDSEAWYLGFLTTVEDILIEKGIFLQTEVNAYWQEHAHLGATQRFTRYFQQVLLAECESPIIVFVDEIDTTLKMHYTDDFFAAIRYFYEARLRQPEFNRLSFVLIGVATPTALISDPKRTPFNVGERIHLTDFTRQEAEPLAGEFALASDREEEVLSWILDWTGGHPYLTQKLCAELATQDATAYRKEDIDQVVQKLFLEQGTHGDDNLKWVGDFLIRAAPDAQVEQALSLYRDIRTKRRPVVDDQQSAVITHLKLAGLVATKNNHLQVRNRLYETVFDSQWIKQQWPASWWDSIPRGIKVASGLIGLLFILLLFASGNAIQQSQLAQERADAMSTEIISRRAAEATAVAAVALAETEQQRAEIEAKRAQQQAQIAQARQLATLGLQALDDQLDLSLLLSIEALKTHDFVEARNNLLDGLRSNRHLMMFLHGHTNEIGSIDFSPDGQLFATGDANGIVVLWDSLTLLPIHPPLAQHGDGIMGVAFSPDGQTLAVGTNGNVITFWNIETGRIIGEPIYLDSTWLTSIDYQPNGNLLAVGTCGTYQEGDWYCGQGTIHILDLATAQFSSSSVSVPTEVKNVVFSPDGNLLAVSTCFELDMKDEDCLEGEIRFWDTESRQLLDSFISGHESWIRALAFSPDGQILASGSEDDAIRLWDVNTQQQIGDALAGHSSWIRALAFSPDGQILASASQDQTILLWDVATGQSIGAPLTGHAQRVMRLAFHPDGKSLVSGDGNGKVIVWDVTGQQSIATTLKTPADKGRDLPRRVNSIAFSPDGQTLASGVANYTITLWDVSNGQPTGRPFTGHTDEVWSVAFSPDGEILASGSKDSKIILWDVMNGQPMGSPLTGHTNSVTTLAFTPDGKQLASSGADHRILFWDVNTGQRVEPELSYPDWTEKDWVKGIAISSDGEWLAATGQDKRTILWDLSSEIPIEIVSREDWMESVAFSPQGDILASGGHDSTIVLTDVSSQQPFGEPLLGHTDAVLDVVFSPDGQFLASGGRDRTIMLWDIATGQSLGTPLTGHTAYVNSIDFNPDGTILASGSSDGTIKVWNLDPDLWIKRACRIANRNLTPSEWQKFFGDQPYRETCRGI